MGWGGPRHYVVTPTRVGVELRLSWAVTIIVYQHKAIGICLNTIFYESFIHLVSLIFSHGDLKVFLFAKVETVASKISFLLNLCMVGNRKSSIFCCRELLSLLEKTFHKFGQTTEYSHAFYIPVTA